MLTAPVPLVEMITRTMTTIDEALGDDFSSPAQLVFFETIGDEIRIGMKALPAGQHPLDALIGFVAPEGWDAFGALGHGWAAALGRDRPSKAPDRRRVRSFHVCARDGSEVGGFHVRATSLEIHDGREAVGMVPDATRRCVGLPTPPPASPVAEVTAVEWLCALADAPGRLALPPDPYESWADLRWEVIARNRIVPGLTPVDAAWMDDGIFSRFLAGTDPALDDALARARRAVGPAGVTEITSVLHDWGLEFT